MATVQSAQIAQDNNAQVRNYPIDKHGKLRFAYFYYKNETGAALAAASEIDLCDLPTGRLRVLPNLSRYRCTALGAARTLDIGYRAYYATTSGAAEAEDDNAFVAAKDVSGAVNDTAFDGGATKMKYDMFSRSGVRLFATINADTFPADAILEGYVAYLYE